MSQFPNQSNPMGQENNAEFQEFVKGVRGRYGSGNYVTIGDIKETIRSVEQFNEESTNRVVSAINSNKAADAVVGENRRIYGINTRILKDTSIAPRLLGEIAANTGERQYTLMETFFKVPLAKGLNAITFSLFRNDYTAAARAKKQSKIEDSAREENRKLDLFAFKELQSIHSSMYNIIKVLQGDKNKNAEEENERKSFLKKLFAKKPDSIDEDKLLGKSSKWLNPITIGLAILGSVLVRFSKIATLTLKGLDKVASFLMLLEDNKLFKDVGKFFRKMRVSFLKRLKPRTRKLLKIAIESIQYAIRNGFVNFRKGFRSWIKGASSVKMTGKFFKDILLMFKGPLPEIVSTIMKAYKDFSKTVNLPKIMSFMKTVFGTLFKFLPKIGKGMKIVLPIIGKIIGVVAGIGSKLLKFVPGLNLIFALFDMVVGVFKGFNMAEENGLGKIGGMFLGLIGGILEFFTLGFLDFERWFAAVAPHFKKMFSGEDGSFLSGLWGVISTTIVELAKSVGDLFVAAGKAIWRGIKWLLVKVGLMKGEEGPTGSGEHTPTIFDKIIFKIKTSLGFIGDAMLSFFEKVKNIISSVLDPIIMGFKMLTSISLSDILRVLNPKNGYGFGDLFSDLERRVKPREYKDPEVPEGMEIVGGLIVKKKRTEALEIAEGMKSIWRDQELRRNIDNKIVDLMQEMRTNPQGNITNIYNDSTNSMIVGNSMYNLDPNVSTARIGSSR